MQPLLLERAPSLLVPGQLGEEYATDITDGRGTERQKGPADDYDRERSVQEAELEAKRNVTEADRRPAPMVVGECG